MPILISLRCFYVPCPPLKRPIIKYMADPREGGNYKYKHKRQEAENPDYILRQASGPFEDGENPAEPAKIFIFQQIEPGGEFHF